MSKLLASGTVSPQNVWQDAHLEESIVLACLQAGIANISTRLRVPGWSPREGFRKSRVHARMHPLVHKLHPYHVLLLSRVLLYCFHLLQLAVEFGLAYLRRPARVEFCQNEPRARFVMNAASDCRSLCCGVGRKLKDSVASTQRASLSLFSTQHRPACSTCMQKMLVPLGSCNTGSFGTHMGGCQN